MFRKVLIANRGEIAIRIIRACRDLGIKPVAVYSEADREALHVKLASEAYCIGPAPSIESYLRLDKIIDAASSSGCEAVHPGYGFLAENGEFARACEDSNLVFIGPSAAAIALMGDKLASRRAVQDAGVPVIPGSEEPLPALKSARSFCAQIGFPVMIKASAGGGGKGMRIVRSDEELPSAYDAAKSEAQASFGNSTVYLEKFIENPRHIEVQVLADCFGNSIHLGERECSIQRRHQKLVEECPSPAVDETLRDKLGRAALSVVAAADYCNAGTVEFLVDTAGPRGCWSFYFLEMNTRLQVEHPVTEMVTGVDLVREQILIANGDRLNYQQQDIHWTGAALECRVYAEDPFQGFLPSPGRISTLFEPAGPGIRNESGVYEGSSIPVEYDPLISKVVAHGRDRDEAIRRMKRALQEYKVSGVKTTIPFFEKLLSHPQFIAGKLHTSFIEAHRLLENRPATGASHDERIPVMAAAIEYYLRDQKRSHTARPKRSLWKDSARRYWE